MVYDVNKRSTFESCCDHWLPSFREVAAENSVIILVGNQIDRCQGNEDFREVSQQEAEEFAKEHGLLFVETSAVLDYNVVDAFQRLLECK